MVRLNDMNAPPTQWGQFEDKAELDLSLSQSDHDVLTIIPGQLHLEGPKIHQPKINVSSPPAKNQLKTTMRNESYVTHSLQLLGYIKELNKLKDQAIFRRERGLPSFINQQSIPPLPPLLVSNPFPTSTILFNRYESSERANLNLPMLSTTKAQETLKKSVAVLTVFHGYDSSSDQALDVLTNATSHFLSTFCNLLRHARDRELLNGSKNGFPDIICRVYTEMSLGSILNLRSYYNNTIIKRYKDICETAEALAFECHHFDKSQSFSMDVNGLFNLQEDSENVPEIHFPSNDDGESLDGNVPVIQTGMQMLESLEQFGSFDPMVISPQDDLEQPMSHDHNAALLLATVSPGSYSSGDRKSRKRRRSSGNRRLFSD